MKAQKNAIYAIVINEDKPSFENTIQALEKSGVLLEKVNNIFSSLNEANTNEEMQKIAQTITPILSKHGDDIILNPKLFSRVKQLYDAISIHGLSTEQNTVLDNYYKMFVRNGANLSDRKKRNSEKSTKNSARSLLNSARIC